MTRHLHFYFSQWTNESRAWRAGALALEHGYASKVDYIGYQGSDLARYEELTDGQRILRVGPEPAPPGSSRLKRALSLPLWWLSCFREAEVDDASLIVAHGLAALPMAVRMARRYMLPLLYDAHELETERAGWSRPIRMAAKLVEKRYILECDHVILVNDSIRDWYLNAYPGINCSVVRNVPVISEEIGNSNLRAAMGLAEHDLVFVYCGVLGKDRGLEEAIEAFRGLDGNRHLVIIGDGNSKATLMAQADGLENVHFHKAVPQSKLVSLLSGADVGIIVPNIEALSYNLCLPNKVFEYAAARLGIILGKGAELERFAAQYPAARAADPTVDSLRLAITAWTKVELDNLKRGIAEYETPSWQKEHPKLLEAFDCAIKHQSDRLY